MMKQFLMITLIWMTNLVFHSQAPASIPYQAIVRSAAGNIIINEAVTLFVLLRTDNPTGEVVYEETHDVFSNAQGLVQCNIGQGSNPQGNFNQIDWAAHAYFMEIQLTYNGFTSNMGTQPLLSVPYALYSNSVPSRVSPTGDTLTIGSTSVIVPGISSANLPPAILGCTNPAACNYNMNATQDDNSCLIAGASCDDGNINTVNDQISQNCNCTGTELINGLYYQGGGVSDIDGNFYTSIVINNQEWMQKNLAVSKYRNGDVIATGLSNTSWQSTTSGAVAIYDNLAANNTTYGKLYNWFAVVDPRGICPTGWHVPSDDEWLSLTQYLGGVLDAGGKMKTTTGWNAPNSGATNISGFTGLPGGYRRFNGTYSGYLGYAYWWSSTSFSDPLFANYSALKFDDTVVFRWTLDKKSGLSVRCVKD
jgi:uncharacterized protein (TIGR02145 family)